MRLVAIKTEEQLDVQAMHRVRDRLVQRRTALINQIRGFLLEGGISFAVRPIHLGKNLPQVIEDAEQNLSAPRKGAEYVSPGSVSDINIFSLDADSDVVGSKIVARSHPVVAVCVSLGEDSDDKRKKSLLAQQAVFWFPFDTAGGVRNNRVIVSRTKADRVADFKSSDSVAALARLRDPRNRLVVGTRRCLATAHPRILSWVCSC